MLENSGIAMSSEAEARRAGSGCKAAAAKLAASGSSFGKLQADGHPCASPHPCRGRDVICIPELEKGGEENKAVL